MYSIINRLSGPTRNNRRFIKRSLLLCHRVMDAIALGKMSRYVGYVKYNICLIPKTKNCM